ncbi:MAG TPA: 23S rRNA (uracil(1939)-C(5))-methyltransferase RlmD [Desulfobacterales bacterium]|nr:23S rRNA (uracil(1939)-C(5))-methyltransferase RlmD [Desulfobacterales bacterium]HIP39295.1 23S rRNA (uracil(1939)-C(5))-methyltransferase RlmD [Desulfocapsa sulfexigens]
MTSPVYNIEKLVHGGFGLSHDADGKVVLIEGTIPGETVRIKIRSQNKNLAQGAVTEIITPSSHRIKPPCPFYQKCGGCDFQHMDYPFQLQAKKTIIEDLLARSSHPDLRKAADTLLTVPLASPGQFNYRQRIRLQVDDRQVPGFHKRRSNHCIAVDNCLLAEDTINDCLQGLLHQPAFDKLLCQTESLEILYDPDSSKIFLLIHFKRKPRPADKQYALELIQNIPEIQNISFTGDGFAVTENDSLSFTLAPIPSRTGKALSLSWETGGFCQVNRKQNEILIQTVLEFCHITKKESVLDLFCGMGNFSIPLAEQAGSLLGIEGQGSAIRSARKNSIAAGQNNTEFIKRPIHKACEWLVQENRLFDCVVIDPPRQGIPGLARELATLCTKRLVYVSCDPATLCRDLADLLEQNFHLENLQLIDMFPQTHHIETIALLTIDRLVKT